MPIYTDKKTGGFFVQFNYEGRAYKKRLPKEIGKEDAKKFETKWKHELFFEDLHPKKKEIVFEDFLIEYFLPFAENTHTEENFKRDVFVCKVALELFKAKNLRDICSTDIEQYKARRQKDPIAEGKTRKPATIVRELAVISSIFSLAVKNDFVDFNPCSRVKKPKFSNLQNTVLSLEDEEKFLESFESEWSKDICIMVLNTGLRKNDVLGLKKDEIDRRTNCIILIQGKTQRTVTIPMNETVKKLIESRWNNESDLIFPSPVTGKVGVDCKTAIDGACERAKISRVTLRDLRRTFGTRLDELNYSSSVKAKLLGHGDLRSVHRYERGTKILREAVLQLEAKPAIFLPHKEKDSRGVPVSR